MKKVLWLLIAVLGMTVLIMAAAAADTLPALQVQLTSATVMRGEFLEIKITNLNDYYPYRFNDQYRIVARAESSYTETEAFPCNDWGYIRIPTQSLNPADLSEEDNGKYRVVVTAMGTGCDPVTAEKEFTVTEPDTGTFTFTISDNEVVPGEQYILSVYAPGAHRIEIFDNWSCIGREYSDRLQMEYGYNFRGIYTYHAYAYYYENGQEISRVIGPRTVTVSTAQDVADPGVTVPGVLEWGEDLVFNIGSINGYSSWNLNIKRASDDAEIWHSWGDPTSEIRVPWQDYDSVTGETSYGSGYRNLMQPGECYNIELCFFRYGYHGFSFDVPLLVVDGGTMVNTIETTVNGRKGTLTLSAPEDLVLHVQGPADATGLLVFAGHEWKFVKGREYRADCGWWTMSHIPEYLFFAKYTTAEIPSGEFSWLDLEWEETTSNVVHVINQTQGWLPAPVVQLDQSDAKYARGEWITATITNLNDFAGYQGVRFYAAPYYDPTGEGFGHLYDWDSATGKIRIPTSNLNPATHPDKFTLSVTALAAGWYQSNAYPQFTVEEPAGTAPYFTVSPTSVETDEDFTISLYAPGAVACRILENNNEAWSSSGSSLTQHWSADDAGTLKYKAQIKTTANGNWTDVGSEITVTVAEAQVMPQLTLSGQGLLMKGENLLLSFTGIDSVDGVDLQVWQQQNGERVWHSWGTEQPFVVYARQPEQGYHLELLHQPGEYVLEAGETYSYRLHVKKRGYKSSSLDGTFTVLNPNTPRSSGIQLLVNGSNASPQSVMANGRSQLVVQAPGATGIRILDPNRWNPDDGQNKNIETEDCWEYYDRNWNTEYLETNLTFDYYCAGFVYAEARYDDYNDIRDWEGEGTSPWTDVSQHISLNMTSNGQSLSAPAVNMASSVTRGNWLTVRITNPQNKGEWYWADLGRITNNNETEWLDHFDFNEAYELAIPTDRLEAGSYRLHIFAAAAGYADHTSAEKTFTISGNGSSTGFLKVNKTSATVGEDIFISAFAPGKNMLRLEITRQGDPGWFDRREWDGEYASSSWNANEPGTYNLTLFAGSEQIASRTVAFTVTSGNGRLTKPDLSGLPATVTMGQAFSGSFSVDTHAKWLDVHVEYISDNNNRVTVYQSHRQSTEIGFTSLTLPAGIIHQAGRYTININTHAYGYESNYANSVFLVKGTDSGTQALTLTVNGSMDDIASWPSSTDVHIQVQGQGATAIRLLRDENWEDVEGWTSGTVHWNKGFGDGDHVLIAQMTTADPVWRADGFDWSSFSWDSLEWTTLSNPVKIHVESQGRLAEPSVTLKVGNTVLNPGATVTRGDVLTVTAAEQDHAKWIWAEMKVLRDNGDWRNLDGIENGHFDSDGQMTLKIPTAGIPAGSYYLQVGVDAENWDGRETYIPLTIADPQGGSVEPGLDFSRDTMQAGEGISILAWAPGAWRMELDITRNGDSGWREHRDTGRNTEIWGWGCGSGGIYTFTLRYFMPNENGPRTITKTLTVISDGSLDQPVLSGVPDLLYLGDGIQGSFTAVEGTEWYNVGIRYSYNGYDWDDIFNEDRRPDQANATRLNFSSRLFDQEGLYQLWVSANAVGKDNGYDEKRIQVLDVSNVTGDLELRVNGHADGSQVREVYLHMIPEVSVWAASGITAVRMINTTSDWEYRIPDENGMAYCSLGVHQGGNVIFQAQATTDTAVTTWANNHNGNMDGFNWNSVNWSISAMPVIVNVISYGVLDDPVVAFPNGDTVRRGNMLEFTISPVEHSDYYGYRIRKVLENGLSDYILDNDINMTETTTIRIPTAALTAGTYRLDIDPRRYGWHGNEVPYSFTVTEITPSTAAVFTTEKNAVQTQETMYFSIYAPGAVRVKLCHESEENVWAEMSGEAMVRMVIPNRVRTYHVMAYALYSGGNQWTQIGNTLEITVTAPKGSLPGPVIVAPASVIPGETLLVTLTCDYRETYGTAECWLTSPVNGEHMLEQFGRLRNPDGTYSELFRLETSRLNPGDYNIEGFAFPGAQGYEFGNSTVSLTVSYEGDNTQATLFINNGVTEAEIFENLHVDVYADNMATAIALYADGEWIYETGAYMMTDVTAWWDGEMNFFAYYTTAALPNDDSWMNPGWSGWTGISNLVRIYVNPPTHELDELTFTVDKTTVQRGEKFRVTITSSNEGLNPSYGATLQRLEEGGQYGSSNPWYGPVSEDSNIILVDTRNIEPGDYLLHVTANAIGCPGQSKDVTVHVTAAVNTLILPSGLTVIEEEAFAGVAAQKIIVPEGVTTIESRAFAGCPNLVEIELPTGISNFAGDAFAQCTHQVKVYGPSDSYLAFYADHVDNLVLEPTD